MFFEEDAGLAHLFPPALRHLAQVINHEEPIQPWVDSVLLTLSEEDFRDQYASREHVPWEGFGNVAVNRLLVNGFRVQYGNQY